MEKFAWIGFCPIKTICGVLGGLMMSWSAYVKICSWGHSWYASSVLPWAIRSARRLPVPFSVLIACVLSS